jgi:hypothetical protein
MRPFVEANQEIGRLHVQSLVAPEPDAEPAPKPDMAALTALVERAINGVDLPGYAAAPDSGRRAARRSREPGRQVPRVPHSALVPLVSDCRTGWSLRPATSPILHLRWRISVSGGCGHCIRSLSKVLAISTLSSDGTASPNKWS